MSSASGPMRRDDDESGLGLLAGLLLLSFGAHVVTVLTLPDSLTSPPPRRNVEMEFYEPPPPPPKVEEPPKPPDPPKELEKPKVKPVVVKVDKPPEPKKVEEPPPPNQEPPKEPPSKPVPIVVGISMSSTTAAGGFAVQVGNTTYGKASEKVVDPNEVKPYSAPKYAPPGGADTEPVPLGDVKIPYPDEAKKNEIEGSVRLRVLVDAEGTVQEVSIISGPGYGLNEAARDAMRKFKFKPATKGGQPVGYTLVYTYTFLLD